MTASTLLTEPPDALDLEEELQDFTADLLALKTNQPFLEALFTQLRGQWVNVGAIVQDLDTVHETLMALETASGGKLQATWLNHPETTEAYCLVLFFMESLGWDNLAVYHRGLIGDR